jgi:aromatic-L-amino-acid decarboxylase
MPPLPPIPRAYDWSLLRHKGAMVVDSIAKFHLNPTPLRHCLPGPSEGVRPGDVTTWLRSTFGANQAAAAPADGSVERFAATMADMTALMERMPRVGSDPKYAAGTAPSAVCPAAVLGEMMAVGISQPGFNWQCSPIATELEVLVCDWLVEALGLPLARFGWKGTGGMAMHSTATEALTTAVLAARGAAAKAPARDPTAGQPTYVVYCADTAPPRVDKAAAILSVPIVRRVPAGNVDALAALIEADRAAGLVPIAAVACVATRTDGGSDDVAAWGRAAHAAQMKLIVDAGHAGIAALLPEHRAALAGWEDADAIVLSAGAWIPMGVNSAFLAFAHKATVAKALDATGAYIDNEHTRDGSVVDMKDYHLGMGRTFRSMRLYATLRALGRGGVEALIQRHCALTAYLRDALSSAGLPVVAASHGAVTLRLPSPELAARVADIALAEYGVAVAAAGEFVKVVLSALRAEVKDVKLIAEAVVAAAVAVGLDVKATDSTTAVKEPALAPLPLALDWRGLADPAMAVLNDVAAMHQNLRARGSDGRAATTLPVMPVVKPGFIHTALPAHLPVEPCALDAIASEFNTLVVPATTHWHHPRFFAFFPAMLSPAGLLGDTLGCGMNQPSAVWRQSVATTELDYYVTDRIVETLGLPLNVFGSTSKKGGTFLHPSATEAMVVAQCAARDEKLDEICANLFDGQGDDDAGSNGGGGMSDEGRRAARAAAFGRFTLYYSADAHFCVEKAAKIVGVKHARRIASRPSDDNTTMDLKLLDEAITNDVVQGLIPFFVSGNVGTTGTCAVDDLVELRRICDSYGAWMNIDASYAGSAALLPEQRSRWFRGWEKADSVLVNGSKWMSSSFNLNYTFLRRWRPATVALAAGGSRRDVDALAAPPALDPGAVHLGGSQAPRGVKQLMTLSEFGPAGFAAVGERHVRLAEYLERRLREKIGADRLIVKRARFGLVCVTVPGPDPMPANRQLASLVSERHGAFVGTGLTSMRLSLAHPALEEADMDALVDAIAECLPLIARK